MPETRRIVLVLGRAAGGVGMHVASLAREFAAAGIAVGVAGPEETNAQFGFSRIPGVRFARLDVPVRLGPKDLPTRRRLAHLIATFRADVVHAHGFRAGLLTVLAVRRLRGAQRPATVVTWHNTLQSTGLRGRAERAVAAFVARGADLTLGASSDLVELSAALGATAPRLAPVAAPPRPLGEAINGSSVRRGLLSDQGVDPGSIMALAIGRVAPQKNYELLLDAAALWKDEHPEIQVVVAGSADEALLARLQERVAAQSLPVHFLGQRDDIAALLHAAHLFVVTSHWEARALVVQEAMAAGRAVVATSVGGLPELIGDAGVLVEADAAHVAAAVTRLAADEAGREHLGAAAARRAWDFPDEAAVAADVLAAYEGLSGR